MSDFKEVFVPVIGFESRFKVSNTGRLISINGFGALGYKGVEREVRCTIDKAGYRSTTLRSNGKKWCVRMHTLVALHFVENKNPDVFNVVNHIDGVKLNNNYKNLEWCTLSMNMHHAHKNKLVDASGMKSVMAKLTDQDVIEMRKKYANGGYTQEQLAKPFGMSRRHVGDIINRVCWKHI
jgi:hypothetical protein